MAWEWRDGKKKVLLLLGIKILRGLLRQRSRLGKVVKLFVVERRRLRPELWISGGTN
jgi:hypothetical protein